jgi:hypothetical protein
LGDNRILTSTGVQGAANAETNLTFDGSTLTVTGGITATGLGTGVDNTVVVVNTSNQLVTDEIDSRVWANTLVDASGGSLGYIPYFTDSNSLSGTSKIAYDASSDEINLTGSISLTNIQLNEGYILPKGTLNTTPSGFYTDLTGSEWDTIDFTHSGEYMKVGTAISVTKGYIYNLRDTGWVAADADLTSTSTGVIGLAIITTTSNVFMINGFAMINNTLLGGTPTLGKPVYVDTTAGQITFTAPTGSGDVVRIVGHCIDTFSDGRGGNSSLIKFNPSNDWIQI